MADAPKILDTDKLWQAYPKLNNAIDNSNEALTKSTAAETNAANALNKANEANNKSDFTQVQLDQVAGASTIDPAVSQMKVDTEGITHDSPDARLRADYDKVMLKTDTLVPKRHIFGGQLASLKESLANPLEQITGIVFIGDSITWGRTLPENAPTDPRDGTLSDPRDYFASPSYVNEFKRYIGSQYAFNALPVLSNWPASPSGEAIAEYMIQHILYPKGGDFSYSVTGTATTVVESSTPSSITGFQYRLDAASTGTGVHVISFPFTGDRFTLSFGATTDALNYELFVDGVSQGIFSTTPGVDGVVTGNDNRREHVFNYVRNKTIRIETRQAGYVGTGKLRLEGIIVNKKIRITNQGINGATSFSYRNNNLAGNTFGDGEAVGPQDNYVFVQIGTNDRIIRTDTPKGSNTYKGNLKSLLDKITPLAKVILMCANPAVNESPTTYSFNMERVRDVVYRTAKENSLDMIDNHAIFNGVDMNLVTADGLHPNELGFRIMVRNIINSLEYT